MGYISTEMLSDNALERYDQMMIECTIKIEIFSELAGGIWSDVLKELDRRGRIKLVSGSYDDVGNVMVQRIYAL